MNNLNELKKFGKEIIKLCKRVGVLPILYGGLLHAHYRGDKSSEINDIDFYIGEKDFGRVIDLLKKEKIKYNYSKKYHNLQVLKNGLKVELDSLDYWYSGKKNFVQFNFEDLKIKALTLEELKGVYKRASEVSKDNPKGNLKKFNELQKLK